MKKIKYFLPLIILAIIIILGGASVYHGSSKSDIFNKQNNFALLKNPIALGDFSLPDLFDEQKTLSLSDIKNNQKRFTIINFFASWCTTCIAEHQALMQLKNEKSVNFFGITWHDYSQNTKDYLKKHGDPFNRVALDGKGVFSQMIGLSAIPETIVLNDKGEMILRFQGNVDEELLKGLVVFLREE